MNKAAENLLNTLNDAIRDGLESLPKVAEISIEALSSYWFSVGWIIVGFSILFIFSGVFLLLIGISIAKEEKFIDLSEEATAAIVIGPFIILFGMLLLSIAAWYLVAAGNVLGYILGTVLS